MDAPTPERSDAERLAAEINDAPRRRLRLRDVVVAIGRVAIWMALTPPRTGLRAWSRLRAPQQLIVGFASYAALGTAALCLPIAQRTPGAWLDHLFNVVSALSTTGLTTISVGDSYTRFGQCVLVILFQLGGIGYMTLSSVIVLARGGTISETRAGVLRAGFSLPHYFVLQRFIVHVVVFTAVIETVGAAILWWRFSALGVAHPLWSGVFHSVSAFATAGFSLNNTSLEAFRGDWIVNGTIGALCYLGAVGFIVVQDAWYSARLRERMLTFTSRVILVMTGAVFVIVTLFLFFTEPSVRALPLGERLLAASFQAMTASTTAGFNSIPIGALAPASLAILMGAMLIGASPSGTGGGIKTTTVSALIANLMSTLRGRDRVVLLGRETPTVRVLVAAASATLYLVALAVGVVALCLTEDKDYLSLVFEAVSALGTVGLSVGLTGDLSPVGKIVIIALMFVGRCGPLTFGLALLRPATTVPASPGDDLAV